MQKTMLQEPRIVFLYAAFVFFPAGGMMYQLANCAPLQIISLRPIPVGNSSPDYESDAVRLVATLRDWERATSSGHCMLFVDAAWSIEAAMFHQPYSDFAEWNRKNSNMQTIVVDITDGRECALYDAIQELRRKPPAPITGMKSFYGSGLVIWFQDGRVVDSKWCVELLSLDKLKSRTAAAYAPFWRLP